MRPQLTLILRKFAACSIFTFTVLWLSVVSASAATFVVTNTDDSGPASLRQAILDANSNNEDDVITFDPSVFAVNQTITLTSGQLTITSDNALGTIHALTIEGTGSDKLTISGNNNSRIFRIGFGARATIQAVTLTLGNGVGERIGTDPSRFGGAIVTDGGQFADSFNLLIKNSVLTNNSADLANGNGGAIGVFGKVIVINTSIINNRGWSSGAITVVNSYFEADNSTISDNAGSVGGISVANGGEIHLTNSQVVFNHSTAPFGGVGGLFCPEQGGSITHVYLRNSIVADNYSAEQFGRDINGRIRNDLGFNIIGSMLGAEIFEIGPNDQLNIDPKLDVGLSGMIPTHSLRAQSPALDQGTNCVLNTTANGGCSDPAIDKDIRGIDRPQDADGDGTATVDIGPFEAKRDEVLGAVTIAPDLRSESDSGVRNDDNITSLPSLAFDLSGLTTGATVELMRDGLSVASGVSTGTTLMLTDSTITLNGSRIYTVRQTVNGQPSLQGPPLAVVFDNAGPIPTINQSNSQSDPTSTTPIQFDVAFNEAVIGFDSNDITLAGSTAGTSNSNISVTGAGPFVASVTNIAGDGVVTASVVAGAVQDIAGNLSVASTSTDNSVTFDSTPPSVTINQAASQADPTRVLNINFTVVFSEPVTGFTNADVSLAGSTANVANAIKTVTGNGTTYTVSVGNITSNGGAVVASIPALAAQDSAGNLSMASTSTDNMVTLDNVAPTVTVNQAPGQSDPTNVLPINYTVVFSEPVAGFDSLTDISFTGSTVNTSAATVTITGSGTTYNVAVAGSLTSNGGNIRLAVRAGVATDVVGNGNIGSSSTDNSVTIDNVPPTVTINQAIGQSDPTSFQPVKFTAVFSEIVSGFDVADVSLSGSTANVSFAQVTIAGSGNVYTISVGNIHSSGQVKASIGAGAAQDSTGNQTLASTSSDNTITLDFHPGIFDFDGDGKSDIGITRLNGGVTEWWLSRSSDTNVFSTVFGVDSDISAPGDFTGDGKTDIAVFRPSTGQWFVLRSEDNTYLAFPFGSSGDIPMPADYDGDGKADPAVFRPTSSTWFINRSSDNQTTITQFGAQGDQPVAADYDGDGKADMAIYRLNNGAEEWWIQRSNLGLFATVFGVSGDKAVPGDYTGDGKADIAVWRPSNGNWFILRSEDFSFLAFPWGANGDIPAPGDYDGDGKTDAAVFRQSSATWFVNRTGGAGPLITNFGAATDNPVAGAFVR